MSYENANVVTYVAAPTAADRDGVCAIQQLAGAGNLLIAGALASNGVATFGEQQRVTIYSAGNLSALTFTVYGLTSFNDSISEAIAGPNNGTVTTTANFKKVTQVAVSGAVGTNVEVGNSNALETPWVELMTNQPLKGISVQLSTGASLTYEVQYGTRRRLSSSDAETSVLAKADTTLTTKTSSDSLAATLPWSTIRLKITSFVSGTATLRVVECPA